MTDFTKLIFTSEADALTNVNSGSLSVTVSAGNQSSFTTQNYSGTVSVAGANLAQMLIGQDNIPSSGNNDISSTSDYMYFSGERQLLTPASVPTAGADNETPTKLYVEISGDDLKLTVVVANPYPDTINVEETTYTVYYFGYQPFQE